MGYPSLRAAVKDLEKNGRLIRVKSEVDPNLEIAEIHRRIFDRRGPAILFEKVKGSPFQALSNLYGTYEQTDFLFRNTIDDVKEVIQLKADPTAALSNPFQFWKAPLTALTALPVKKWGQGPVGFGKTSIDQLPQIVCWPMDGGPFVTLPQVCTLPPGSKKAMESNIGMYRIQLNGNEYIPNKEIGLHYQLHRGIGVHHTMYNETEEEFKVSIFIGGPPSHAFSAIMPLPEGLSEMTFAGMMGGRRFRYSWDAKGHIISNDADFVITGVIKKNFKKPEGPFGDHLGYYSLTHEFPVMEVHDVYHRKDAIWHFTVVGRPPQEDSSFGYLIHQLVKPLTTGEFPGVREIHAVDVAGVHPLLLAIGSERYMPFRDRKPEEILSQANHILGKGQTTLAKYLIIAAEGDAEGLTSKDMPAFFHHVLERIDWRRDLHFQTRTTIDTLDYSGSGWNEGSKVVMACAGPPLRTLTKQLADGFTMPTAFDKPQFIAPGILAVQGPKDPDSAILEAFCKAMENQILEGIAMIVVCDDSAFAAAHFDNFLWLTFTRSNPSHDIYGVKSSIQHKHWGCEGPVVIDARKKAHHAPELVPDDKISAKVDALFMQDAELKKWR